MFRKHVPSPSPGKGGELTCKEIQQALGLKTASAATKAWDPTVEKFARMMFYFPVKAQAELASRLQRLAQELPPPEMPPFPPTPE